MGSTAGTTYKAKIEGKLITGITASTTTGITYKIKQVNGATPTHPTAAHRLHIEQKTALASKHEIFNVAAGTTQSGQTVTLGTVTRALPLSDGTDFTGSGTAQSFGAGADIFLTWDEHDAAMTPKLDLANTFTAKQSFSAGADFTGVTRPPKLPSYTTTERDALTPETGFKIVNTTTGTEQTYYGGAWNDAGTSTTANGSTTVAGKFEEATVAEQGSATATGGTGARLVPAVANLVKTSSGSGDENKIPILNASGQLASGFVNTSSLLISYPGMLMLWTTDTAPTGWLLCYGQTVSQSTYAALYAVIGHTYGADPGSGNFILPDLRGRFPLGKDNMGGSSANRVTDTDADTLGLSDGDELKDLSHTHGYTFATGITNPGGGGNWLSSSPSITTTSGGSATQDIMPPFLTLNYIIKT